MICCFTVKRFMNMSLPTAGMVIGWFCVVINIFQIGLLSKVGDFKMFLREHDTVIPEQIEYGTSVGCPILITIYTLDLFASIFLIVGINKKNHLMLLPWLINNAIFLVGKMFLGIMAVAIIANIKEHKPDFPNRFLIILVLALLVFFGMVWNAVYSLYKSIRKSNKNSVLDTESLVDNSNGRIYELFRSP